MLKRSLKMSFVIIPVVLSLGFSLVPYSYGKDYPTRPIEIIVTYGPGTINDLVARLAAEIAKKHITQPLIVANKPGAAATTGVSEFINSKPDGYKVIYLPNNYFATTVRTQKVPFDPSHLVPLISLVEVRQGLAVRGDSPFKTLNQFLDYGRQNPGKLRVGNPGRGAGGHLCQLIIFKRAGVEVIEIPYVKGTVEILPALLGGHLDASSVIYSTSRSHLEAGKLRFLVTYSDKRYPVTPDVPSAAELGYETIVNYHVIYVHKDTPEDIKKTIFDIFKRICEDPRFKEGLEKMGDAPRFEGPEFIKESTIRIEEMGVPILKELGLYVGEPPKLK